REAGLMTATWYYLRGGQQHGPVSFEELRGFADRGWLRSEDLVWQSGMPDWQPARAVRDLFPEGAAQPWSYAPAAAYPGPDGDVPAMVLPVRRPPSEWPRRLTAPFTFFLPMLFFLLPWIDVHCNGFTLITQSGLQSSFGGYSQSLFYTQQ